MNYTHLWMNTWVRENRFTMMSVNTVLCYCFFQLWEHKPFQFHWGLPNRPQCLHNRHSIWYGRGFHKLCQKNRIISSTGKMLKCFYRPIPFAVCELFQMTEAITSTAFICQMLQLLNRIRHYYLGRFLFHYYCDSCVIMSFPVYS